MFKGIQQVSIKGLLYRDGKVLVLKEQKEGAKSSIWELPGGRIDYGEKPDHAFKREMKEELGFKKVKMGKFINTWSFTSQRDGVDYHFIILDFAAITDEIDIKLSFEHVEYKWVGVKEISKLKMRAGHKESIRKFFKEK